LDASVTAEELLPDLKEINQKLPIPWQVNDEAISLNPAELVKELRERMIVVLFVNHLKLTRQYIKVARTTWYVREELLIKGSKGSKPYLTLPCLTLPYLLTRPRTKFEKLFQISVKLEMTLIDEIPEEHPILHSILRSHQIAKTYTMVSYLSTSPSMSAEKLTFSVCFFFKECESRND